MKEILNKIAFKIERNYGKHIAGKMTKSLTRSKTRELLLQVIMNLETIKTEEKKSILKELGYVTTTRYAELEGCSKQWISKKTLKGWRPDESVMLGNRLFLKHHQA